MTAWLHRAGQLHQWASTRPEKVGHLFPDGYGITFGLPCQRNRSFHQGHGFFKVTAYPVPDFQKNTSRYRLSLNLGKQILHGLTASCAVKIYTLACLLLGADGHRLPSRYSTARRPRK